MKKQVRESRQSPPTSPASILAAGKKPQPSSLLKTLVRQDKSPLGKKISKQASLQKNDRRFASWRGYFGAWVSASGAVPGRATFSLGIGPRSKALRRRK